MGTKVLLPLDILSTPNFYTPQNPSSAASAPHNSKLSDLILIAEENRLFFHDELKAGRFPLWNPAQFAGAPAVVARLNPFALLGASVTSPNILAWVQLLEALTAGIGCYAFFRKALRLAYWPSAIGAWIYPLTGFLVLWQGFNSPAPWFPWLMLCAWQAVKRPNAKSGLGLAAVTALTASSGLLDMAGQALLCCGLFALWNWAQRYRCKFCDPRAWRSLLTLAAAWAIGLMLVSPDVLPRVEYARTGARVARRTSGVEERPPIGIQALPPVAVPFIYGSTEAGSLALFPKGQGALLESTSTAYAGLLALLVAAPLAWCDKRRRAQTGFHFALAILGLCWSLNVPGITALLRLPGLSMMSHNRLTFATAHAVTVLAALGLNALWRNWAAKRLWFLAPIALLAGIAGWSGYRLVQLPEPLATQLAKAIAHGAHSETIRTLQDVERVQQWFTDHVYQPTAMLASVGLLAWALISSGRLRNQKLAVPTLGLLMLGDLLWFAYGRSAQCDPALYFPAIPALEQLHTAPAGRMIGYQCLPPRLAEMAGLHDVRGYDAVDPSRFIDLMTLAASPESPKPRYAQTQWFLPKSQFEPPDGIRLSPVLDLLNVRYVIFRGTPPPGLKPAFQSSDYWVAVNHSALPRAFVPERVETAEASSQLTLLGAQHFDPKKIAYVESNSGISSSGPGTADILNETPDEVTISANMQNPGLLILADLWDKGWHAFVGEHEQPVLKVDYALRGVALPAGKSTVQFRYQPGSLRLGLALALFGIAAVASWALAGIFFSRRRDCAA